MRTIILTLLCLVVQLNVYTQVQPTPEEEKLQLIKAPAYELRVPMAWRQLTSGEYGTTRVFDASGVSFPEVYNSKEVVAIIFVIEQECSGMEEAKNLCLRSCAESQGKKELNYTEYQLKHFRLASGQQAYRIYSRFYRTSNNLYQSRYDLVSYSEKTHKAYLYTVTLQYNDGTTTFERQYNLDAFSGNLFSRFLLK